MKSKYLLYVIKIYIYVFVSLFLFEISCHGENKFLLLNSYYQKFLADYIVYICRNKKRDICLKL